MDQGEIEGVMDVSTDKSCMLLIREQAIVQDVRYGLGFKLWIRELYKAG
jgi:hypothetical protein